MSSKPAKMMQVTAKTQARAEIRDCQLQHGHWQGSTSERAEKTATAGMPTTLKGQATARMPDIESTVYRKRQKGVMPAAAKSPAKS
jgi:hypothetical protein